MKKLLAFALSLLMLFSLAACGNRASQQPAEPDLSTGEETAPEEKTEQTPEPETEPEQEEQAPETQPEQTEETAGQATESEVAAIHNQDAYDNAYLFHPETDGNYVFRSASPEPDWENPDYEYEPPVTWTVYALDEEFDDAWRFLGQANQPVICDLDGEVVIPLKAGQYVYCVCSVNGFTMDPKADDTASLTISTTTAELGPTASNGYVYPVTAGAETKADLDGDGVEDTIYYSYTGAYEGEDGSWMESRPSALWVNEKDFLDLDQENPLEPFDIWLENPDVPYYYIVDLDAEDNYKELAICDWGSNDWTMTHLFRYEGGKLDYIGTVTDFPDGERTTYHGDGSLSAYSRFDVMQTWGGIVTYELKDGTMERKQGEMVQPMTFGEQEITLKQPLTVYASPDRSAEQLTLQPSPQPLSFPQTDTEHWVQIQCADGTAGWAYFEDFAMVDNNGTMVEDSQIFDGLLFAG